MSHAYVVRPKVDKSGETEKIRYYGVPVTSGQVSTNNWLRISLPGARFQEAKYWRP